MQNNTTFLNLANNLFTYYKDNATLTTLPNLEVIMAAPIIPVSMAEAMAEISPDFLMPGIGTLEQNGVYMLNMNQKIVEAYLAGANYEMNRELIWREYPTDQRGTPLRHFWGTKNVGATNFIDSDEKNMDINKIHTWRTGSTINNLGVNSSRKSATNIPLSPSNMVVLAIRGELLKKYPNTNIYMQKAKWQTVANKQERVPDDVNTKKPLFFSQINPDLYFVGFEISATDAKGSSTTNSSNPGWFVCFEERAGEIVFGADEDRLLSQQFQSWDDLCWTDFKVNNLQPKFIDVTFSFSGPQQNDNVFFGTNSADMGYILYQKPSRVFIHSNDMLN